MVQGVGFRPFVWRLARSHGIAGWVLNTGDGVEIHVEGDPRTLDAFATALEREAPVAARVDRIDASAVLPHAPAAFEIRHSAGAARPTAGISPDLAVCDACLRELRDPADRRFGYPCINCTECGPRYSIMLGLPYDRPRTTMHEWPMCSECAAEYANPADRRFHAQPVACPRCGPGYVLRGIAGSDAGDPVAAAAALLRGGRILAVKGLGGYHLACDGSNAAAVEALRTRKFRKERPFALLARDLPTAKRLVRLERGAEAVLTGVARPIVLAPALIELPGVAPDSDELGVMLPSTPLHHLLFDAGAPPVLVLTSGNRSGEPIAFEDSDAAARLTGIADAFLVGDRPIARRMDDSVVRPPVVLRRARGLAPGVVARIPTARPLLGVGADLKNAVVLVVGGEAVASQHIGDLDHALAREAFATAIDDLLEMYDVDRSALMVAHDAHPGYVSSAYGLDLPAAAHHAVQHHRAHVASVLAEQGMLDEPVIGIALDGTGWGDDGTIWGCELFTGSVAGGLVRAAHLLPAVLPGGDAAARWPVQAAAGFLAQTDTAPAAGEAPFELPERYARAAELVTKDVRCFPTTSAGRLFDTAAALLGFTREITYEGQAAVWLEHLAHAGGPAEPYPMPYAAGVLDYRPLLAALLADRRAGRDRGTVARAFHGGLAAGLAAAVLALHHGTGIATVVLSGGVFQNELLSRELRTRLAPAGLRIWSNRAVPPNDGGIALGQVALAAFAV
ncbi:MAG: carbamoyltransferase HypF [Gemmatimonadales bacterium]|nr:carbamoyltransferase HypF [Gemmatimonadales bacterium]